MSDICQPGTSDWWIAGVWDGDTLHFDAEAKPGDLIQVGTSDDGMTFTARLRDDGKYEPTGTPGQELAELKAAVRAFLDQYDAASPDYWPNLDDLRRRSA